MEGLNRTPLQLRSILKYALGGVGRSCHRSYLMFIALPALSFLFLKMAYEYINARGIDFIIPAQEPSFPILITLLLFSNYLLIALTCTLVQAFSCGKAQLPRSRVFLEIL